MTNAHLAPSKKRLVIGISGASGVPLAIDLLQVMQQYTEWETHVVLSPSAKRTIREETDYTVEQIEAMATCIYAEEDIGASIASGTFKTEGMIVIPCSMKTLAGIQSGYSDNLLLRAADVTIKERRKLVLVARETPLSPIHLRNMASMVEQGAIILPPMLTFYNRPETIQDMVRHIVGKALDIFGLDIRDFKRWGE